MRDKVDWMCSALGDNGCDAEYLKDLVRRRDPAALDRLAHCYGDRLLRAGRRHCRTGEEAKDAVQDTFVTAATHLEDFRGEGSLEGWLVSIVASACRRLSRGHKNDPQRHEADQASLVDSAQSPEAETAQKEIASWLNRALLELSEDDRLVLLLAEVDGMTGPEIAEELHLTAGAVRVRLSRARDRLRKVLSPLDLGPAPHSPT
jgi:RNA polymerase sigma-70 factor (ECF subfamily)